MPNTQNINAFYKIENIDLLTSQDSVHQKGMIYLKDLLENSSYYFSRFVYRLYQQYFCHACYIQTPEKFDLLAEKLLKQLLQPESFEVKRKYLGEYYDLKFFQLGIQTLSGMEVLEINKKFTSFTLNYFKELFNICSEYILNKYQYKVNKLNKLAIYASGGLGREKAFEDDFDLIIITDTAQKTSKHLIRELIALMNKEILKIGTLPHFRFSEYSGEYFCFFDQLKELLASDRSSNFIDKSQILQTRLLAGTKAFNKRIAKELVEDIIFADHQSYIQPMIQELHSRHSKKLVSQKCTNIKECSGGLRDIEMIVLIYKVYYKLHQTYPYHLIDMFIQLDSKHQIDWYNIRESLKFLQRLRYFYRLMVSAEEEIQQKNLNGVATKMIPNASGEKNPTGILWEQFISHRRSTCRSIRKLIRPFTG